MPAQGDAATAAPAPAGRRTRTRTTVSATSSSGPSCAGRRGCRRRRRSRRRRRGTAPSIAATIAGRSRGQAADRQPSRRRSTVRPSSAGRAWADRRTRAGVPRPRAAWARREHDGRQLLLVARPRRRRHEPSARLASSARPADSARRAAGWSARTSSRALRHALGPAPPQQPAPASRSGSTWWTTAAAGTYRMPPGGPRGGGSGRAPHPTAAGRRPRPEPRVVPADGERGVPPHRHVDAVRPVHRRERARRRRRGRARRTTG